MVKNKGKKIICVLKTYVTIKPINKNKYQFNKDIPESTVTHG